ncbi:MAG: hypothetical protein Q4A39_01985 [Eubacteriales bacterium]|nr:hypothetical protein [Eubacteriales bacterium]
MALQIEDEMDTAQEDLVIGQIAQGPDRDGKGTGDDPAQAFEGVGADRAEEIVQCGSGVMHNGLS